MQPQNIALEEVYRLADEALQNNGCDEQNANAVARTITRAERDGCASHGLFRLPGYLKALKSGKANGRADPKVEQLAPSVVRVDGDLGFAPLAHERGRSSLIELTRETGFAAQPIIRTHHFSALWAETEPLAEAGLAAFAFTAYMPSVAPAGGRKPFFGTNPLSFAWPRGDGAPPMVFDMATAAMARGEIMIAARDGHEVPAGAGVDADGAATTDPKAILGGAQLPFGGYKGSAIALMVELLSAGLMGEAFSDEAAARDNRDGGPPQGGELLIAIDPARFGDPEGWLEHSNQYLERLGALEGVRLPGDRRRTNRERIAKDGVSVPQTLLDDIAKLAGA
ncbi:MAG: Ldh family oxidoreductase [Rhodobacteraceae bacterium]|nr:Ldh family oxidoreductase [Paracoccaceae bacterium]